jgi:hypothetical protein
MHRSSLVSISILHHASNYFDDVMGEILELSFSQCFPQTRRYLSLVFFNLICDEIEDIVGFHHSINGIPCSVVEYFPCTIFRHSYSCHPMGYVKCEPRESCLDTEAL